MATAHLVYGFIGAGKTTLAKQLEIDLPAVRFTPDDWMRRLFGEDPPADAFQTNAAVILDLMEPIWMRCLALGVDVVLDFGFWRRAERDRVRELTRQAGAETRLHVVECTDEEARRRINSRNSAPDRSLYIAPATYDMLKARLDALSEDEVVARRPC